MFIHLCRSWRSVIRVVSSVSVGGDGEMDSLIVAAERWAGREDRDAVVWCVLCVFRGDIGPLYATGLEDREAVRNERYCPTLGMKRV